jgi:hypothetical protein
MLGPLRDKTRPHLASPYEGEVVGESNFASVFGAEVKDGGDDGDKLLVQ